MLHTNPLAIAAIAAGSLAAYHLLRDKEPSLADLQVQDGSDLSSVTSGDLTSTGEIDPSLLTFGLGAGTGSYQYYRA